MTGNHGFGLVFFFFPLLRLKNIPGQEDLGGVHKAHFWRRWGDGVGGNEQPEPP